MATMLIGGRHRNQHPKSGVGGLQLKDGQKASMSKSRQNQQACKLFGGPSVDRSLRLLFRFPLH